MLLVGLLMEMGNLYAARFKLYWKGLLMEMGNLQMEMEMGTFQIILERAFNGNEKLTCCLLGF